MKGAHASHSLPTLALSAELGAVSPWMQVSVARRYRAATTAALKLIVVAVWVASISTSACAENANAVIEYDEPKLVVKLKNRRVNESSGLAASRHAGNRFWTHNDSGDKPRLYCFDLAGHHLGTCHLIGAAAVDWEDICSFQLDGRPKLLIADTGDNLARRKTCRLYLADEPKDPGKDIKKFVTLNVRYSSGPFDCEAVGVDPVNKKLLFVEKRRWLTCRVFEAELPTKDSTVVVGDAIAQIELPIVTAMDVSPDGHRAIVLTLGQGYEFTRGEGETWTTAFSRQPRKINMPPRKQGESICYGANGRDLFLTSEFAPAPLFVVKAKKFADN